jgi:hypothetical protein
MESQERRLESTDGEHKGLREFGAFCENGRNTSALRRGRFQDRESIGKRLVSLVEFVAF